MSPKLNPVSPLFLKGALVVIIVASMATFYYKQFWVKPVEDNSRIGSLEKTLQDIRSAMNVDSVRQFNIQKVMSIIDRYNKSLPSSLRYEIAEEIYRMSIKYTQLDLDLICATVTQESGKSWDPEVVSQAGAMGLMQIMPTTGLWIAHYEDITWTAAEEILFDPVYNIRIGCRYLATLIKMYDLEGGLAAFNGGEKRAAIWLANEKAEGILLSETLNYKNHVLLLYEEFKSFAL